ncbi:MAG: hypothetical protein HUJ75_06510, partial [Parasporobacterium sp.]|nr:hypothetical protein [Parasporobacterium sp.]
FRKDNRTAAFFRKVRQIDPSRSLYIAKADFHDYGASVDQDILLETIKPFFLDDPDFFAFASWIMTRNEFYKKDQLIHQRVSIIQGLPIGNFFNNLYLRDMDLELEKEAVLYMRYADDIACFTETREQAERALETVAQYAKKRNLTINEEKSGIILPGEEAEILGIQIFPGGFDIGDHARTKLKDKLMKYSKKKVRRVTYGKITYKTAMEDMIRYYDRIFFGKKARDHELNWVVHAFPMITRIDGLKDIDACAQEAIRYAGTGKRTNSKYRVRYKQMCKAGYKSLVHAYYHGYEITNTDTGHKEDGSWQKYRL